MIAMKLAWLGLLTLSLWAWLFFGSPAGLALAGVLILLPLLGLVGNRILRKGLELKIEASPSVRKGDAGSLTLTVRNPGVISGVLLRCRVRVENQLNRQISTQTLLFPVLPRQNRVSSLTAGSAYCGRVRISLEKITLFDCFGLIGLPCTPGEAVHLVVQPDTFGVEPVLLPNPGHPEDSEDYSQERPGQDLTETYQLREYVPGDSPRQIHWKLSGKFDRLIVRDPGLPIARNVLVFWERTGDSGNPEAIDAQAEVVVSLCRGLVEGGISFTLGWNDTDRNLCVLHEIRNMDTLVGIIPRLLRATGRAGGIPGAALLTQPGALCAHMVYIGENWGGEAEELERFGHVTYLKCGEDGEENTILFTPENYRRQLAQLEL